MSPDTPSYTLIGSPKTRAFRPLWMLHELGLPFEHLPVFPHSDEAARSNPTGKVPVLLTDGAAITDSTAILTYLADRHGQFTAPAGTLDRARQDAMTYRILDELDAVLWTAARHSFMLPEAERVPEIKPSLKTEFARNLSRLAAEMTGPFVMGDAMSVPDLLLVHCGAWAKGAKFPDWPDGFGDYMGRMTARPAYRAAAKA